MPIIASTVREISTEESPALDSLVDPRKTTTKRLVNATSTATAQRNRKTRSVVFRFAFSWD